MCAGELQSHSADGLEEVETSGTSATAEEGDLCGLKSWLWCQLSPDLLKPHEDE